MAGSPAGRADARHGDAVRADPPYRNCPVGGTSFPELLETVNGRQIISPAEAADLFDPAFKKHVLLGNGRYHNSTTDGSSTTKLHWAVSLTAVD